MEKRSDIGDYSWNSDATNWFGMEVKSKWNGKKE
jgi:hypothetical protein